MRATSVDRAESCVVVGGCYGLQLLQGDEVPLYLRGQLAVLAACAAVALLWLSLLAALG